MTATFPPYWAGTGNVVYHNALLMHERGHDVTVLTADTGCDGGLHFPFAVQRLPTVFRVGNAPLTPSLAQHLRGFDLIHLHYPYIFGAEFAVLAARRFRIPLLITYHNDLVATGARGLAFTAYSLLTQRAVLITATRIACTSRDYAAHSRLASTGPRDHVVSVIPNGVDCRFFRPDRAARGALRNDLHLRPDDAIALFVGGLDRAHHFKGVKVLLRAAAGLDGLHLLIVGDGDQRPAFERQASVRAPGRVHFLGKVSQARLRQLYQGANLTVLPSVTQGEAFGMVLIESLACGTPVVASNLPGVRTVVDDGRDGWLAAAGSEASLAQAMGRLLSDPLQAERFGMAGCEKVQSRYDWEVVGDQLASVYAEVVRA